MTQLLSKSEGQLGEGKRNSRRYQIEKEEFTDRGERDLKSELDKEMRRRRKQNKRTMDRNRDEKWGSESRMEKGGGEV